MYEVNALGALLLNMKKENVAVWA